MTDKHNYEKITENLLDKAKKAGADAADVLMLSQASVSASNRMKKLEATERSEEIAIGLRVFSGKRNACVSSSDISDSGLIELADRAVSMAQASIDDPDTILANPADLSRSVPDLQLADREEPDVEWFKSMCSAAEDSAMAVPGISNSEGAEAEYSRTHVALRTMPTEGDGFFGEYTQSYAAVSVSVLAGSGTEMERDYAYATARFRGDLPTAESIGKEAGERAVKRLHPKKVGSVTVPVIFDPRVGKNLLSYLVQAINGSTIVRGTSFLKSAMDTPLFAPSIHIHDDPLRMKGLASKPFDGEGVAPEPLHIIEGGILKHWLLDTRTAKKLGLRTNGHAARGVSGSPSPSSSNLYMEAGEVSPTELIADIKQGLLVTDAFGGGVNIITGDYSQGVSGFWIENGEITHPVSEITIAGHLKDMFTQLIPANDLHFKYSVNVPTLRIDRLMIAGG